MKAFYLTAVLLLLSSVPGLTAIDYPYDDSAGAGVLQAYWYNVKEDSVKEQTAGHAFYFQSLLQIYGKVPADTFEVRVEVYSEAGEKVFARRYCINKTRKDSSYSIEYVDALFKLVQTVERLEENPARIRLQVESPGDGRSAEIACRYHKMWGRITDFQGKPFRAFVSVRPDAFESGIGVWSDRNGYYEIQLPERTYNSIYVDDESYRVSTLECWGWHIILDRDECLDFKVGNGEVYNLSVWPNNGGWRTYFIAFRPMALPQLASPRKYPVTLDARKFDVLDIAPELGASDITVTINGEEVGIISFQKFYETGSNGAMPAYLIQVGRGQSQVTGKKTVRIEYEKEIQTEAGPVKCNSLGVFQFLPNLYSLSYFF